jgi:hypothetical protein
MSSYPEEPQLENTFTDNKSRSRGVFLSQQIGAVLKQCEMNSGAIKLNIILNTN